MAIDSALADPRYLTAFKSLPPISRMLSAHRHSYKMLASLPSTTKSTLPSTQGGSPVAVLRRAVLTSSFRRAYVVPFDKEILKGGPAADEFAHSLRKHIEAKHAPYKW